MEKQFGPHILQHYLGLDTSSRYERFMSFRSDAVLIDWCQSCINDVFFIYEEDGNVVGLLHLSAVGNEYEAGISVWTEHRGKGIGKKLVDKAIAYLSNVEDSVLYFVSSAQNGPMRRLAASYDAYPSFEDGLFRWNIKIPRDKVSH